MRDRLENQILLVKLSTFGLVEQKQRLVASRDITDVGGDQKIEAVEMDAGTYAIKSVEGFLHRLCFNEVVLLVQGLRDRFNGFPCHRVARESAQ